MNHEPGPLTRFAQFIETSWQESQQERKPLLKSILRWLTPNGGTILIALLLVLTQSVWANNLSSTTNAGTSAATISYQGRLADSNGNPITQNDVAITFTIYDAANSGNALWTEQHVVNVANGLFNVGLGDLTQDGIPTNIWNGDRYLEITVGSETLSPRELIRSVPLAGMALTVADHSISTNKLNLSYDTACFNGFKVVNLPGNHQQATIPDLSLTINLENSSRVLVWMDGLARFEQPTPGEIGLGISLGSSASIYTISTQMNEWWNIGKTQIINLPPGQHILQLSASSWNSGTLTLHGGGAYKTCINYLIIDED